MCEGGCIYLSKRLRGPSPVTSKCKLKLQGTNSVLEGIAFFQEKLDSKKVRAAYKLNVNSFRGNESLQLMIESIESL